MFFASLRRGSEINSTWFITRLANQRAKNTIHLRCAIYSGSSPPAKSPLAFWTWNPGLNSTSPRLIDISDPNCPLFQRKPLLCLLLPSPPLSKCCPTLSTYRVARNVGGSLRAPVCKNQTNSKFRGKSRKFDFFHILMLERLGYN